MRIAVDARPLVHPTTGIGRYSVALIKRLRKGPNELLLYSHRPIAPEYADWPVRHGNTTVPALGTAFAQAHFGRWAREDGADLFWSPRHHLPVALGRIPSVVTIHDLVWRLHPETMIRMGRLVERLLMPRALDRAARVIAVSRSTANDLARFYPVAIGKTVVIPEASDLAAPADTPADGGRYFLFVGTLEPRKNLARVLAAFSKAGCSTHRLVVAGNPGWKSVDTERSLRTAGNVDWLGKVEDDALAALYAGADCVVVPSLYEGFGLQVVEALSFGVPVITSNASSLPEVAGDAGLLVDPASTDAIAEAMHRIAFQPGLRDALAERARRRSALYSWDRAAEATAAVFADAANGGR